MKEIRDSKQGSVFRDIHGIYTREFILQEVEMQELNDHEVDLMGFIRDDATRTDVVPWGTPATSTPLVDLKRIQW